MENTRFDPEKYEVRTIKVGNKEIKFRAFTGITYCENPKDEIQKLNIFAPECYYHGGKIGGYTVKTAPIFLQSSVGGYLPGPAEEPGKDFHGDINTLVYSLEHGYVTVSVGVRGRTTGKETKEFFEGSAGVKLGEETGRSVGKAPALIVDWKAGIRFLRHFKDAIPGDTEKIITNGTSAGGAISAMAGAAGNHPDYEPYLAEIGAFSERDDVYAASCYCPIHNLEHADMAYEWLFADERVFHARKMERTENGPRFFEVEGEMSEKQMKLAGELKKMFPKYVNGLSLEDVNGQKLTLSQDGTGTFSDYVKAEIVRSAREELEYHTSREKIAKHMVPGSEPEKEKSLLWKDGMVVGIDLSLFAASITRMKQTPAFDGLGLESAENEEFGNETIRARHFTEFSYKNSEKGGDIAEFKIIKMLNPTCYIRDEKADTAKYWRIRHGSHDRDTAIAIPEILKLMLKQSGNEVDFALPWGIPHRGDYDLPELFEWIDGICR